MHPVTSLILSLLPFVSLTSALPNAIGLQERFAAAMPEAFAYSNVGPAFFGQLDRRQPAPEAMAYGDVGPVYFGQLERRQHNSDLGIRSSHGGRSSDSEGARGVLSLSGSSSSSSSRGAIFTLSPEPLASGSSSSYAGNSKSDESTVQSSRPRSSFFSGSRSGSGERLLQSYVIKCRTHRTVGNMCTVRCQCDDYGRVRCPPELSGCEEECICRKDARHG